MDPRLRYKIRTFSAESYREVHDLLAGRATILLENEKRHSIAATDIDDDLAEALKALDAEILPDIQYDPE